MPEESLAPDEILAVANLRDTNATTPPDNLADISDDPAGTPDSNWWTAVNPASSVDLRVGFPTPSGPPTGSLTFYIWLRKTAATLNPTVNIELWESGAFVAVLLSGVQVTSTTGQLLTAAYNLSSQPPLDDPTGAGVEIRVTHIPVEIPPAGTVALDNFTAHSQASSVDPWSTFTHSLGANADYVLVLIGNNTTHTYSVTFGGVAMTAGPTAGPADGTSTFVRSFYLVGASLPTPGTKNVVVDPNGVAGIGRAGVWSLSGVAQGAPARSAPSTVNTSPTNVVQLTGVAAGTFIASGLCNNGTTSLPSLAGGTTRFVQNGVSGGSGGFGDTVPTADGVSVTHTWTHQDARGTALMVELTSAANPSPHRSRTPTLGSAVITRFAPTVSAGGSPPPGTGPKWMAYYPAYDQSSHPGTEIPFSLGITHLAHFAAMPQVVGGVSSVNTSFFSPPMLPTNLADIKTARSNAGSTAKILMVVGGANTNSAFVNAVDNNQTQLINDIMSKVTTNGYDGVDVDWEGWAADLTARTRLINFHAALGQTLHNAGKVFTSSSFARHGPSYDSAKAEFKAAVIDTGKIDFMYIQFIAHTLPGFAQQMVWHHSSTNHDTSDYGTPVLKVGLKEAIPRYLNVNNWPANKLICGHQWGALKWVGGSMTSPGSSAGRGARFPIDSWSGGGVQPTASSEQIYRQIIAYPEYATALRRDVAAGNIPFLAHTGATAAQDYFLPFEDAQSIAYKTAYVLSQGLAGMGVWHIGSDYKSTGTTVAQKHPLAAALSTALFG